MSPCSPLSTPRLRLSPLTLEDAPFILELVNDPDWLRHIGDRNVRSLDARRYLRDGPIASYARNGFGLLRVARGHGGADRSRSSRLTGPPQADKPLDMEFAIAPSIEVLERTPAVLHAMLGGVSDPWVSGTEGPDTFSPFDVVGHLIDGEETDWMPRARIVLARGADPRFEPYDRFRHRARNAERTMASLLAELARLRAGNLDELRSLPLGPAELALTATHPTLGAVTLRQLLAAWVVHDLEHIAQAARVMAKQYGGEVGPWVPFLPVLTDHPVPRS